MTISKAELWDQLQWPNPADRGCSNCRHANKNQLEAFCNMCYHCHDYAQANLWEDRYEWDGEAK